MTPNGDQDRRSFNTRGTVTECDLCGEQRQCIDGDGMVACTACQSDLLPSGWGLWYGRLYHDRPNPGGNCGTDARQSAHRCWRLVFTAHDSFL